MNQFHEILHTSARWKRALITALPLLVLPLINLLQGIMTGAVMAFPGQQIALLCSWVSVEEILFRRILPDLCRKFFSFEKSIIMVNIIFALCHLTDLFNGRSLMMTMVKILFAFGAGYCFSVLAEMNHSILPGMIIHFLINISGMPVTETPLIWALIWCIAATGCFFYGYYIMIRTIFTVSLTK